jgi:uncharacterized phage protein gp47/JayE
MAGITDAGFVIKRLADILADDRALAVQLFQDLIQPGDQVDVSDSSALGRLISLAAPSEADLWEAAQEVYAAFDPNSATGIALDNLVALGGVVRQEQTFSTAQVIASGDTGTTVALNLSISSSVNRTQWNIVAPILLDTNGTSGASFTPLVVADSTLYTITYEGISTTNTVSYTSTVGATATSIVAGLANVVTLSHPSFTASINGTTLTLTRVDPFSFVNITTSANLSVIKIQKVGEVKADVAGDTSAEANTLTVILTPQLGWDSVTNPIPASEGLNLETDEELRIRFRNTKFERASSTVDAIYSALNSLVSIEKVVVYENDTDVTDSMGIPSHSFHPIILGGLNSEIGQTIWENKPMGIRSYGDTTVVIHDSQGFAHNIQFKRPDPVPIYITMTLTKNSDFPGSGNDDIKSALISFFQSNVSIGDDVIYSRLYTPINSVPGHFVNSLFIGTAASPTGVVNIPIDFDAIATLSSANISIIG